MTIAEQVATNAKNARQASIALARLSTTIKNEMLLKMADALEAGTTELITENAKDLTAGKEKGLSDAMLDRLMLERLRIGEWFRGSAVLKGRGRGQSPAVEVTGGRLDLRKIPDLGGGSGGGGGGSGTPITARLDAVTVTESIALTGLRGDFGTKGGFNGRFEAALNGQAPLRGTLLPAQAGTAIRVTTYPPFT